ncbi:MAG: enoyl-CoA hydratase-related protein [Pseudomonadota bacterium]|nr:enoyl-CoA hydratase-related protein [Pseudomonadota bacterium]
MTIRVVVEGPVARVTIDRPGVLNALDAAAAAELEAAWQRVEADRTIRAVVLTGAGERAFCVGADMRDLGRTGLAYWAHSNPAGFGGLSFRTTLDIPVIARVNGHALGGGLEMVLGCDIAVAASSATLGLTEPRVGRLPLDGGMVLLQRQIGYRAAMGMLLTGRRLSAAEAQAHGLINEAVPLEALDDAVGRWLSDILACAPLSLRAIKQAVRRTAHLTPNEAQAHRTPALVECLCSSDAEEGVRAFREKRAPVWTGR